MFKRKPTPLETAYETHNSAETNLLTSRIKESYYKHMAEHSEEVKEICSDMIDLYNKGVQDEPLPTSMRAAADAFKRAADAFKRAFSMGK